MRTFLMLLLFASCGPSTSTERTLSLQASSNFAVADGVSEVVVTATLTAGGVARDDSVQFSVSDGGVLSASTVATVGGVATTRVSALEVGSITVTAAIDKIAEIREPRPRTVTIEFKAP